MPARHRSAPRAAKGPSQRQLRVGEVLRHALTEVLRESEIRDPDLEAASVTVTEVRPSPDMRHALVFVEPLGGKDAERIVEALNRNKSFCAARWPQDTSNSRRTRSSDRSFAEFERIDRILRSEKVARDLKAPRSENDAE